MGKSHRVSGWAFNGVYLEASIFKSLGYGEDRWSRKDKGGEEKGGTVKKPCKEYQMMKIQGSILQFNYYFLFQ